MAKKSQQDDRLRILLAQECARIIASEGVKDFALAKRKAVARLGVASSRAMLPSNLEIEQALLSYQQMFFGERQEECLQQLRRLALRAMRQLAPFQPQLVGSVLNGTAGPHADIELHAFADTPEDVMFYLMDRHIAYESAERRQRTGSDEHTDYPVLKYPLDEVTVDLTLFCGRHRFDVPYSPVDGRPMKRAKLNAVENLVD